MAYSRTLFGGLILLLWLGSCAPLYIPNRVNTPLLSHQGELQAGAFIGSAGFEPQASYAVTNHFGLLLNGSFTPGKADTTKDYSRNNFIELGLGYYRRLGERTRFELFTGYGFGNMYARYNNGYFTDYRDAAMQRVFIQPDIGFSTAVVDGGLAMRFVVVNARQGRLSITRSFLEPAVTLKAGFKYIKFVYQFGLSLPLNANDLMEQQPFVTSLGVQAYLFKGY